MDVPHIVNSLAAVASDIKGKKRDGPYFLEVV
ncbi:hypothetical protein SAMN02745866_01865 [Alteromonadaceae bacterium Bs31]|nr:hypothetical protein SAMN02745866_01865 [Alteromonadaceae bacterium Bs31]